MSCGNNRHNYESSPLTKVGMIYHSETSWERQCLSWVLTNKWEFCRQRSRKWHSKPKAHQVQRHRTTNQHDVFKELQVIWGKCKV